MFETAVEDVKGDMDDLKLTIKKLDAHTPSYSKKLDAHTPSYSK